MEQEQSESSVKQRRPRKALSEHQQLIIAVVLVILLASSLLYCLGFGSLVVRQVWERAAAPAGSPESIEELDVTPPVTNTLAPPAIPF